jgi:hypothetical protein
MQEYHSTMQNQARMENAKDVLGKFVLNGLKVGGLGAGAAAMQKLFFSDSKSTPAPASRFQGFFKK